MAANNSALSRYLARAVAVLAAGGLLFLLFTVYMTAEQNVQRAYTYRLAPADGIPVTADGDPVAADDLQRTVAVLTERLQALGPDFGLHDPRALPLPPDAVRLEFTTRWSASEAQQQHALQSALAWLTMRGRTTFRLVHPELGPLEPEEEPPAGYVRRLYRARQYRLSRPGNVKIIEHAYAVDAEPALVVERFGSADIETSGMHKLATVTLEFPPPAAPRFATLTALNVGRELAMLVDGEMYLPPRRIENPVTGGRVQIQGYFFLPPVRRLVKVLNTGSLPHALEPVEPRPDTQ